jgi:hypothetical protein
VGGGLCLAEMRLVSSGTSRSLRFRQGAILLAGAIVVAVAIGDSSSGFYYTPLALGLTYLAGAIAGGSQGSYWATAVTLVGWGAAVVFVHQAQPNLDTAGLYLAGAGIGASVAVLLARRGFAVDPLGVTATVAVGGALLTVEPRWHTVLGDARYYALFLAVVGVANLVIGATAGGATAGDPASGSPATGGPVSGTPATG